MFEKTLSYCQRMSKFENREVMEQIREYAGAARVALQPQSPLAAAAADVAPRAAFGAVAQETGDCTGSDE